MRALIAALFVLAFVACPLAGLAGEQQIADVKALAGTWQGWVTAQFGQERATMVVKEDGSYQASTPRGVLTSGSFYLQEGKLRYRSSISVGTASVSEDQGKTFITLSPEGPQFLTGKTEYQRVK